MASNKTDVIEYLFDKYWDQGSKTLRKEVMTLDDVQSAILACNEKDGKKRSTRNPANFLKDIVRGHGASKNWPARLAALRYSGEQRTGSGECFAFVPFADGQDEPFPDLYRPNDQTPRMRLQSVSLPELSKTLGRSDEAWLVQTAVNLRVVEQHLATQSEIDVREIVHLQMNVKLRAAEIDALFAATTIVKRSAKQTIITCEAKREKERILVGQITSQVRAAFASTEAEIVIPLAVRSVKGHGIQLIEFEAVARDQVDALAVVSYRRDVLYELVPPVKGI